MKKLIHDVFKNYESVNIYSDEENIPKSVVEDLQLEDYCVKNKYGWKISFVGFIIRKSTLIISFPKKYKYETSNITVDDVNILTKLISKITTRSPVNWDSKEVKNSFPLKAYLDVCNYYVQKGFHFSQIDSYTYGYSGKIDWNRTIRHSPNYIQDGQIHYMPYVISKKNQIETLITNAMKYVLEDGYRKVGEYFNIGIPYFDHEYKRISSYDFILSELRYLKSKIFNDYEISLINSLISYFEWITGSQNEVIIVTMNFETTWQKIVNEYLINNLDKVLSLSPYTKNIKINFGQLEYLNKNQMITQKHREDREVVYDFLVTDGKYVLLFDSKYYMNIDKDLDYKQLSYHYLIKLHDSVPINPKILNALIAPTEMKSHSNIHIDLTTNSRHLLFAGVRILIFNLNTKEVMLDYVT